MCRQTCIYMCTYITHIQYMDASIYACMYVYVYMLYECLHKGDIQVCMCMNV